MCSSLFGFDYFRCKDTKKILLAAEFMIFFSKEIR